MKKVFIGIIIVSLVGVGIYVSQNKKPPVSVPVVIQPSQTPEEFATWEDPNGFKFQYPKSLIMNTHNEDTENYAHLEFTNADHPGSVIVWGKDTKAVSASAWVKAEKALTEGTILDTTMAGIAGKKVLVETPKKQIVTVIIDEGVVFYVEGNLEDIEYWTSVHTTISNSFEFINNKPTSSESTGADEEYIDEEEVIE